MAASGGLQSSSISRYPSSVLLVHSLGTLVNQLESEDGNNFGRMLNRLHVMIKLRFSFIVYHVMLPCNGDSL
ncbi:hypothetical protein M430DRAFT_32511 [Amorphotheca resinae ATCC 22711]|jgi:hypothetical protein|uniref:Uncharacterized protein n=1 Tax=Amorphotheca resinae ATCC 22711 TaxID=857342 RepID=A0A2T3BF18_AMORE|nr:hypothetical protein M430DRAFT_32511 [Amorphotheca resinae ATCC 22711]PSS27974.1 hypothetical protein M430DRAFT_32511 [Amorphotheca resinae ATCC 22711]